MQRTKAVQIPPYLFGFRVRNLPESALALLVSEVEIITEVGQVTAVPLAQPAICGICYWEQHVVTLLDLAAALCGTVAAPLPLSNARILIAKVPVLGGFQYLGWPIEGDASIIELIGDVYRTPALPYFEGKLIEESLTIGDTRLVYLRLAGLFE